MNTYIEATINDKLATYDTFLKTLDLDVSSFIHTMWDVPIVEGVVRSGPIVVHIDGGVYDANGFTVKMGRLTLT